MFRLKRSKATKSAGRRLDTWKEIAAYLKRDVRTVQRWEREESLPVRRHSHNQLPTVYAYRSELDSWWNNRRGRLKLKPSGLGWSALRRTSPARSSAIALGALLLAGVAWYLALASDQSRLAFQKRDWLLVTRFDNRSGDPLFEGTIQYAMERELANSRFVNIVPRPRIEDTLRLMRRPPDSALDRHLAREICLRDGAIRAFLTGRVEKLGSTYVLWAEVVDPARGTTVASWSQQLEEKEKLWPALRRLCQSVREGLGEPVSQIQHTANKLELVTTPSLVALRLFSEGDALLHELQPGAAANLFKLALAEDPAFAVAHMWMAYALRNDGHSEDEWIPHVEEAVRLSEHVSEPERLVILAKAQSIRGNAAAAIPLYEALLRLDPDQYWGTNNLLGQYFKLGRFDERVRLLARLAALRPQDPGIRADLAYSLANHRFDFQKAETYCTQARTLFRKQGEIAPGRSWLAAWVETFPILRSLAEHDPMKARHDADAVASQLDSYDESVRSNLMAQLVSVYLTVGQVDQARELSGSDPDETLFFKLLCALHKKDVHTMKDSAIRLHGGALRMHPLVPQVLARTGQLSLAEQTLASYRETAVPDSYQLLLGGEIAAAEGQIDRAKRALEKALEDMTPQNNANLFLAAESLARIHREQGDLAAAIRVLEGVGDSRRLVNPNSGPHWLRTRLQLIDLYDRLDREIEKLQLKTELERFLSGALKRPSSPRPGTSK